MSNWLEIISSAVQAQATIETCSNVGGICPATAYNAVAAAFATQGYYMQADVLFFLTGTGFGVWAALIYMLAAAGGIISLAMGMPPRMYMWFFVGPGIYHWLVETRSPTHGVQWRVANVDQDQRPVWRMANVGLTNMPIVARLNGQLQYRDEEGTVRDLGSFSYEGKDVQQNMWCRPALDPVYVSNFFLWFDSLISYTVQRLVSVTGVDRTSSVTTSSTATGGDQGVLPLPASASTSSTANKENRWYLMADKKWVMLDTITSARLANSDIRNALAVFVSSECGDALSSAIDQAAYAVAMNSENGHMPCSTFLHTNTSDLRSQVGIQDCRSSSGATSFLQDRYSLVWDALRKIPVPISESHRRIFQDDSDGSFIKFLNGQGGSTTEGIGKQLAGFFRNQDSVECHQSFYTIVQALRWESAQIFHQLIQSAPPLIEREHVLFNLFYGWGARDTFGGNLLTAEQLEEWTRNLIFVHLVRNELAILPRLADRKFTAESTLDTYAENYIAQPGAKAKYGEVYSWARMIPYIQGVLLYLLAMAYPFACIMIVMPGWHKTIFTWMSFWVWVKMWDAGFAVVSVMERSVWSMLGNSSQVNFVSPMIFQMADWSQTAIDTTTANSTSSTLPSVGICFADIAANAVTNSVPHYVDSSTAGIPWWNAAALFDRALLLGSSLDIDVANGYYIYLMSALYFAVPAATGQLVLGAKAGVAGMVSNFTQGISGDSAKGVGGGFQGDLRGQVAGATAARRQELGAANLKKSGLADKAFGQANQGLDASLGDGMLGAARSQLGLMASNTQATGQSYQARQAAASATSSFMHSAAALQAFGNDLSDWVGKPATEAVPPGIITGASRGLGIDAGNRGGDSIQPSSPTQTPDAPQPAPSSPQARGGGNDPQRTAGLSDLMRMGVGGAHNIQALAQMGGGFFNPFTAVQQAGANMGYSQGAAAFNTSQARRQAELNSYNSGANLASFGQSSQQGALQTGERRYSAAAEFGQQSAVHYGNVDQASSVGGYLGSIGGDSSQVSPQGLPSDMTGLALGGRLGAGSQARANYAMQGFWGNRGAAMGSLQSQYGTNQVQAYWGGDAFTTKGIAHEADKAYATYQAAGTNMAKNNWEFTPPKKN